MCRTMKAFKYRLSPTRKQTDILQFTLDRNRKLSNAALEERREAYRMCGVSVNYEIQSAQLPEIKELRPEDFEISAQVLQDILKRVDKAFKAFFKRCKEGKTPGFPRFQGRERYDSLPDPQVERLKQKSLVRIEDGRVILPKIGHIKVKQHRPMEGKVKTCTIKREGVR
jgi:putative transposase